MTTTDHESQVADIPRDGTSTPRAVREPTRAWRAALDHLEGLLLAGGLEPGDHLPPERQLAADLGVSRSSVREAIRVLDALGLVRTATGSGPTAGAIIVASPTGGMTAVMRLQVAAQGFPIADVVQARLVVEPAIAAHLAESFAGSASEGTRSTRLPDARLSPAPPDLAQASALLDAMDAPKLTPAEFLALDARFHVALAEASGNTVLSATMAGLRDSIEGYVLAVVPQLPSWAATSDRLRTEHREIVAAIERGDPTDAARRLRAHVAGYFAESRAAQHAPPATARSHFRRSAEQCPDEPRNHASSALGRQPDS